ncbi:MAG: cytochrome c oxidase subunit 3 [Deltaproteobacteria bacterium]|nr:cytochrome c oxidase subunit 3 [Deltaproteobacteria bacterium]
MPDGTAAPAPVRRAPIDAAVFGVVVAITTELMFFAGLLSAYNIARGRVPMSIWPPPDQPRLPIESTAVNSMFLFASGILIFLAIRALRAKLATVPPSTSPAAARLALVGAVCGALFVALQGREWVDLLAQGLTMQRSTHASFFYLIVGCHGLHAIAGIGALGYVVVRLFRGTASLSELRAAGVFWAFVVLIWPAIYGSVYLS